MLKFYTYLILSFVLFIGCGSKENELEKDSSLEKLIYNSSEKNSLNINFLEKHFKLDDIFDIINRHIGSSDPQNRLSLLKNRVNSIDQIKKNFSENKIDCAAVDLLNYVKNYEFFKNKYKIFLLGGYYPDKFYFVTNKNIEFFSQFKNEKISCIKDSADYYILNYIFKLNNLKNKNIKWTFVENNRQSISLLNHESVRAAMADSLSQNDINTEINKELLNHQHIYPMLPIVFIAHKNCLKSKKDAFKSFALEYINASKSYGKSNRYQEMFIPVNLFDNLSFFDLNKKKSTSIYKLFSLYNNLLGIKNDNFRSFYSADEIIMGIYKKSINERRPLVEFKNFRTNDKNIQLFTYKISFKTSYEKPDAATIDELIKCVNLIQLFPSCEIRLKGFSPEKENAGGYLTEKRISYILKEIRSNYQINSSRIIAEKGYLQGTTADNRPFILAKFVVRK